MRTDIQYILVTLDTVVNLTTKPATKLVLDDPFFVANLLLNC